VVTRTGFVEVDGGRLAWTADGEGPAILLVHAGVADQRMWEPLVPLLAREHLVVRFDLRGFGRTSSSAGTFSFQGDALAVLDAAGVSRAAVVGASYGGKLALDLAAAEPDRVAALILLAPGLNAHQWSDEVQAFGQAEDEALERGDIDSAVELNLRMWVDGPTRSPQDSDPSIRALVADMQRRVFELQLQDETWYDAAAPQLSDIAPAALVMVWDRDVADFARIAERLAEELPHASLARVEQAGHLLALELPELVAGDVLTFLRGRIPAP
jgi:3-oxoadipate enol-lactonase